MRDSVPSGSYSSVCNVLRQWKSHSSLLIESTDSMIESTDSMIYTDSEIIVLTRWGSLRLAPINIADKSGLASARPIIMFQAVRRAVVGGVSDPQVK